MVLPVLLLRMTTLILMRILKMIQSKVNVSLKEPINGTSQLCLISAPVTVVF